MSESLPSLCRVLSDCVQLPKPQLPEMGSSYLSRGVVGVVNEIIVVSSLADNTPPPTAASVIGRSFWSKPK